MKRLPGSFFLIASVVFVSALTLFSIGVYITSLESSEARNIKHSLLSEGAGIVFSAILALTVYSVIDRQRKRAEHRRMRQLSQDYIADLVHNFIIASAVSFPIQKPDKILACVASKVRADEEVCEAIKSLKEQINDLPFVVESGKDLSDIATFCYEQEKSGLEQISGLISRYVGHIDAWPDLIAAIFQFNTAMSKLSRSIALQKKEEIPGYLKKKPAVYLSFMELIDDMQELYGEIAS